MFFSWVYCEYFLKFVCAVPAQQAITCSKLTLETTEEGVEYD